MVLAAPPLCGAQHFVDRYGEMQSQMLKGNGRGLGLDLFLRHGMRAWIEAWSECPLPLIAAPEEASGQTDFITATSRGQAGITLAAIALNIWRKEADDDRAEPEGHQRAPEARWVTPVLSGE
jgi:hypothetical protein